MIKVAVNFDSINETEGEDALKNLMNKVITQSIQEIDGIQIKKISDTRLLIKVSQSNHDKLIELIKKYHNSINLQIKKEELNYI